VQDVSSVNPSAIALHPYLPLLFAVNEIGDYKGLESGSVGPKKRPREQKRRRGGGGLFGIEAAAQHYFRKSASQLNEREAALLATSLPNPVKHDASHPSSFQRRLAAGLVARARDSPELLDCLPR
jgi:hypothetical protein